MTIETKCAVCVYVQRFLKNACVYLQHCALCINGFFTINLGQQTVKMQLNCAGLWLPPVLMLWIAGGFADLQPV